MSDDEILDSAVPADSEEEAVDFMENLVRESLAVRDQINATCSEVDGEMDPATFLSVTEWNKLLQHMKEFATSFIGFGTMTKPALLMLNVFTAAKSIPAFNAEGAIDRINQAIVDECAGEEPQEAQDAILNEETEPKEVDDDGFDLGAATMALPNWDDSQN